MSVPARVMCSLLAFVAVSPSSASKVALFGEAVGKQDLQILITPPAQSNQEIRESLDDITELEDAKYEAEEKFFNEDKQAMVNAERKRLRGIAAGK